MKEKMLYSVAIFFWITLRGIKQNRYMKNISKTHPTHMS